MNALARKCFPLLQKDAVRHRYLQYLSCANLSHAYSRNSKTIVEIKSKSNAVALDRHSHFGHSCVLHRPSLLWVPFSLGLSQPLSPHRLPTEGPPHGLARF